MARRGRVPLPDLEATRRFAGRLADLLRPGDVVALTGPLGAGKTELARALIRARAGAAIEVPSPSFTLVQDYPLPGLAIRHVDLYRVEGPDELLELGIDDPGFAGALLIEWPERAAGGLPADRLDVRLEQGPTPDARIAEIVAGLAWADRLPALLDA